LKKQLFSPPRKWSGEQAGLGDIERRKEETEQEWKSARAFKHASTNAALY
jgi:hypothetical protein